MTRDHPKLSTLNRCSLEQAKVVALSPVWTFAGQRYLRCDVRRIPIRTHHVAQQFEILLNIVRQCNSLLNIPLGLGDILGCRLVQHMQSCWGPTMHLLVLELILDARLRPSQQACKPQF